MNKKPISERFWSKVKKTETCWLWIGAKDRYGYGQLVVNRKKKLASHVSWMLSHGEFPKGLWVLHKCDNPACVRPDHLFLGTRLDNVADMCKKGRAATGQNHGSKLHPERIARHERSGMAKLTTESVKTIREKYQTGKYSNRKLAQEYGVTHTNISAIVLFKTWKDVA
jgi:hypothetical protein